MQIFSIFTFRLRLPASNVHLKLIFKAKAKSTSLNSWPKKFNSDIIHSHLSCPKPVWRSLFYWIQKIFWRMLYPNSLQWPLTSIVKVVLLSTLFKNAFFCAQQRKQTQVLNKWMMNKLWQYFTFLGWTVPLSKFPHKYPIWYCTLLCFILRAVDCLNLICWRMWTSVVCNYFQGNAWRT